MSAYKDIFNFDGCKRCGKCCENGVVVFEDEIEKVISKLLEIAKKSHRKIQILLSSVSMNKFDDFLSVNIDREKIATTKDPEEISQIKIRQLFTEPKKRDIQFEIKGGDNIGDTLMGKLDYCLNHYKKTCLLEESRLRDCRYFPLTFLNDGEDRKLAATLLDNCEGILDIRNNEEDALQQIIQEAIEDSGYFDVDIEIAENPMRVSDIPKEIKDGSINFRAQIYSALKFIRRS